MRVINYYVTCPRNKDAVIFVLDIDLCVYSNGFPVTRFGVEFICVCDFN